MLVDIDFVGDGSGAKAPKYWWLSPEVLGAFSFSAGSKVRSSLVSQSCPRFFVKSILVDSPTSKYVSRTNSLFLTSLTGGEFDEACMVHTACHRHVRHDQARGGLLQAVSGLQRIIFGGPVLPAIIEVYASASSERI